MAQLAWRAAGSPSSGGTCGLTDSVCRELARASCRGPLSASVRALSRAGLRTAYMCPVESWYTAGIRDVGSKDEMEPRAQVADTGERVVLLWVCVHVREGTLSQ